MRSKIDDIIQVATSASLSYQQKLFNMANVAERLVDAQETLKYTKAEVDAIDAGYICDLNEGDCPYRPRYIVPDYQVYIEKGCKFLELAPPSDLDECLDGLLILYHHIPSITSFPVYIGQLDELLEPFITDKEVDGIKIKRFLNHIDKTIVDSFCHANIGPKETQAGHLILDAVMALKNPTPNLTLNYVEGITPDIFAQKAVKACLLAAKPSFSNYSKYVSDVGEHSIVSCYNALPLKGGAYTLPRLRLGTLVKKAISVEDYVENHILNYSKMMLSIMDKRVCYIKEESHFFETSFLVDEGYIHADNFTAMFGIVGLADAVNYLLHIEGIHETYGQSKRGDEIAHKILSCIEALIEGHEGKYVKRTNHRYLFHAQVGANLLPEDKDNTPAHRIRVGEEPILPLHLIQSAPFHEYFKSGTGDLFAFDQTYLNHLDAVLDIIKGAFNQGYRYITTYLQDSDLIRVTGYLVKRSEVMKVKENKVVLRDTDIFGSGTNDNAHVFERRTRD